jgi:indole-3-glycerol phosphate synthase
MILEKIVAMTIARVEQAKTQFPLNEMKMHAKIKDNPFSFEKALKQNDISFICEIKKASPSKGIIADEFPFVQIAKVYENAGATAISVLTEPDFFMGNIEYLREIKMNVKIPVLQKDFIIDEYQIYEASAIGADAILLICAILDKDEIIKYIKIADSLGLSCLVEGHDESEVKVAIESGARIIGVNNRNLNNFEVDICNSVQLRKLVPSNIIFVSESGISTPKDINELREINTNAVLIGEKLMRSSDIAKELNLLKGKCYD